MGSTIDDEVMSGPHYPWPWAHAPAMIEADGVELVAGVDLDEDKLADFGNRWGVKALYTDVREMVAQEKPDIVSVTTRLDERPDVVAALAEGGAKVIFPTKPLSRTLAQADEMIEVCRRNNAVLAVSCHLNWYAVYTNAREIIDRGDIGQLRSMICNSSHKGGAGISRLHSHTFALFRLFAGAPVKWVFGYMDDGQPIDLDEDLVGSGYAVYENDVRAFLNSRSMEGWDLEFICERGRVVSRNTHAWNELWGKDPETGYPVQRQFPNPWRPRSSMVDAFQQLARCIETGEEPLCPGEYGREALEIAIGMRESHRRGGIRVDLPLEDRSLGMSERTMSQLTAAK